jgi:uncharacterized membrane protein YhaH (DUF805 family)
VSAVSSPLPARTSARRTASLSLTLAGRATRTELASYILAAVFITMFVSFATALFVEFELRSMIRNGLALALAIPVPALLVRRLHDQNRPGTLAWLAVFGFAVWAVRTGVSLALGTEARIGFDKWTWALDWLVILANLGAVLFAILPGTPGSNRFGPDPRAGSAQTS